MSLFKRALEDNSEAEQTDKTILMKGPLAEIYTNALDIAYAKNPETGERVVDEAGKPVMAEPPEPTATQDAGNIAQETEAIDVMMAQQLARAMAAQDAKPTDSFQTVYGVSKDNVDDDVVVDVTKEIVNQPENSEFILIMDGTQPSANGSNASVPQERMERMDMLTSALEAIVEVHGGKVYKSLKEFTLSRQTRS